jgi:bacteriocin-like protein
MSAFETISATDLNNVNGGGLWGDVWDATRGAVRIVASPISATYRGVTGTVGALRQGHNVGDSLANGLVQAAGTMNAPNLANIPAR